MPIVSETLGLDGEGELVARLRAHVAPDFGPENVGHDLGHLDRVWGGCRLIAASEGGDREILAAAAYLHDLHRALERRTGTPMRPQATADHVRAALAEVGFPATKADGVLACVHASGTHSFATDPESIDGLEPAILKDADNLDAMGAVGIARACMFGAALGEPLLDPEVGYAGTYSPGRTRSIVHHFHEKLLRLEADMQTETGLRLARDRHAYMVAFLEHLEEEIALVAASEPLGGGVR